MLIKNLTLNHDSGNFHSALGVTDDIRRLCQERIFFTTFANAINTCEGYANTDDAPAELRTLTGNLKHCLSLIDDKEELQYEYTLLTYMELRRIAMECFSEWWFLHDPETSKEDRRKYKMRDGIIDLVKNLKGMMSDKDDDDDDHPLSQLLGGGEKEEDLKEGEDKFNKKGMLKRVDLVKKANFSFEKYWEMVSNMIAQESGRSFTEELLRNLGKDSQDDE